jgi:hypothetical protein
LGEKRKILDLKLETKNVLNFFLKNDFLLVFQKNLFLKTKSTKMYWTLASHLSDAPWPANRHELIDYATCRSSIRSREPQSIEDEGEIYESMEEIWPDYPTDEDYL